jgi:hypothetical protein
MINNVHEAVEKYICLRDENKAIQQEADARIEANKEKMKRLEAYFMGKLNETGANSMSTDAGRFHKQIEIYPRAVDWDTVYNFIKENDAYDLLEKRLTKTFVKKYMEENEEPPPGVAVQREYIVKITRS